LRVLLVDNYDSFTHNLAQLVAAATGALPEVVRNDAATVDELLERRPDAILISPGPGSPAIARDVGVCAELVRRAGDVPLLGVCLGHQVIAVALGGEVVHAPEPMHGRRSAIRHDGRGLFAVLPAPLEVVRYHSLVLARGSLPAALEVTAWTDDGLVMAIAHRERPLLGVQFHPESILTDGGRELVGNFLALVSRRRSRSPLATARPSAQIRRRRGGRRRVWSGELPWVDPERAFVALYGDAPSSFWLDGDGGSYMGAGSDRLRVTSRQLELDGESGRRRLEGDPFDLLQQLVDEGAAAAGDSPVELPAGWVGYLGYELKESCEGGTGPRRPDALPDAQLMLAERVLAFDEANRRVLLCCLLEPDQPDTLAERARESLAARLAAAPAPPPPSTAPAAAGPLRLDRGRGRYLDDVRRILGHLRDGDVYEVCLTTQVRAPRSDACRDPLDVYRVLRRQNPAPRSSFVRFPDVCIVSASPERFVHIDAHGLVESRPIKGTRRRGTTADEDRRAREALAGSVKDRAENLMIVDLVRNDLGRVCAPGSVHVPEMMNVEPHPTVHQMVSTVRGRLAPEVTPLAAVRALFPGGSMTGAPKIRAMEIIAALEGEPRGVYSGGVGFLSFTGAVDLAMAIRTLVVRERELSFGVGGAVVALSDPEAEFDEALLKGEALARALGLAPPG
jgi:para-aminobenzoate synthetase